MPEGSSKKERVNRKSPHTTQLPTAHKQLREGNDEVGSLPCVHIDYFTMTRRRWIPTRSSPAVEVWACRIQTSVVTAYLSAA